jgi:putative CRISPR-associated protein (TIGR02620 family)
MNYGRRNKMNKVVVTRHPALVDYLVELGLITKDTEILTHVTREDIAGKDVIGVLPLHLAAAAWSVTEVPLDIPAELRGKELDLEDLRQYAGKPVTYHVLREDGVWDFTETYNQKQGFPLY